MKNDNRMINICLNRVKMSWESRIVTQVEGESRKKFPGFTVVEVLISLMLISFSLMSISLFIIYGLDGFVKSGIKFKMTGEIENRRNLLSGKAFDSIDLKSGIYSEETSLFLVRWDIRDVSPTLKYIRISVTYKYKTGTYDKQLFFYKSKFIESMSSY